MQMTMNSSALTFESYYQRLRATVATGHPVASDSIPWRIVIPTLAILYLSLVQLLRFRGIRNMERKYAAYLSDPYKLDYKQAQEIMKFTLLHEFPFLFSFGTQWALIKSYGIASGTPLLVKTRQLADYSKAAKRAEDTGVLLGEFLVGDPDSERGRLAMSKLNWMHHRYDILEGDYVHTLALFVLEPHRWIEKFDWRSMTYLERVAHFVFWKEIGYRMGFGGIPETLEDLITWKAEYQKTHLYYAESNKIVTEATMKVFLKKTPKFLHGFVTSLFISFIEEKDVREALGFDDPPAWATFLTSNFFLLRGFFIRHFVLPRMRSLDPLAKPGADGRYYRQPQFVAFEPWYVADTWYNRLILKSKSLSKPGKEFKSNGYLPEEIGPVGTEKSRESVRKQAEAMDEYVRKGGAAGVGCPFNFGW